MITEMKDVPETIKTICLYHFDSFEMHIFPNDQ